MPRLKAAIDIDASREHVFAAAEPSKWPDWAIHIKELTVTEGDGQSAGTKDKTVIKVGPVKNRIEGTWTEYKPGEAFARQFSGYLKGEERLTFTETKGGTRVEWAVNYTPPFGPIGKIGALLVMARVYLNDLESSLERLKGQLEV